MFCVVRRAIGGGARAFKRAKRRVFAAEPLLARGCYPPGASFTAGPPRPRQVGGQEASYSLFSLFPPPTPTPPAPMSGRFVRASKYRTAPLSCSESLCEGLLVLTRAACRSRLRTLDEEGTPNLNSRNAPDRDTDRAPPNRNNATTTSDCLRMPGTATSSRSATAALVRPPDAAR